MPISQYMWRSRLSCVSGYSWPPAHISNFSPVFVCWVCVGFVQGYDSMLAINPRIIIVPIKVSNKKQVLLCIPYTVVPVPVVCIAGIICARKQHRHYIQRQPALFRTLVTLGNPICAQRFHRHYSGQPALYRDHYLRHTRTRGRNTWCLVLFR